MGRSSSFICHTCKKNYYLGYGSYSSWLDLTYSLQEFEEKAKILHEEYKTSRFNWHDKDGKMEIPPDPRDWYTNENVKKCLTEHQGHEFEYDSEDFQYNSDDLDPKIKEYESIDLDMEGN